MKRGFRKFSKGDIITNGIKTAQVIDYQCWTKNDCINAIIEGHEVTDLPIDGWYHADKKLYEFYQKQIEYWYQKLDILTERRKIVFDIEFKILYSMKAIEKIIDGLDILQRNDL